MAKAADQDTDLYGILSNQRRRYAVHAIKRHHSSMELGDLADQVTAWEAEASIDEVSARQRKSVYTSLQQVHLPRMDEAEIVDFDKERGTVEPTPKLEEVDIYLELVEGNEIPWHQYYFFLALIHAAVLFALWLEAWPFTLVSGYVWGGILVGTFILSAIVHNYYMRGTRLRDQSKPPDLR